MTPSFAAAAAPHFCSSVAVIPLKVQPQHVSHPLISFVFPRGFWGLAAEMYLLKYFFPQCLQDRLSRDLAHPIAKPMKTQLFLIP